MNYLRLKNAVDKAADLFIYGPIGSDFWGEGITDKMVAETLGELDSKSDTIRVHIDSPGGDAAQGLAIYNLLVQHDVRVETIVEGWAASAASIIMQAGDVRKVAENGLVMIHSAWGGTVGNKVDHRKTADILEKLDGNLALTYARRSASDAGPDTQAMFAYLMEAETWFNGQEAVDQGLADEMMSVKMPTAADKSNELLRATSMVSRAKFAAFYKNGPTVEAIDMELMRMRIALARIA